MRSRKDRHLAMLPLSMVIGAALLLGSCATWNEQERAKGDYKYKSGMASDVIRFHRGGGGGF